MTITHEITLKEIINDCLKQNIPANVIINTVSRFSDLKTAKRLFEEVLAFRMAGKEKELIADIRAVNQLF